MSPNTRGVLLGAGVAAAIVVLALYFAPVSDRATAPAETVVAAPSATASGTEATDLQSPALEGTSTDTANVGNATVATTETDTEVTQQADDPTVLPTTVDTPDDSATSPQILPPPLFDLVRIEPDGSAIIAGTAPGADVIELTLDGSVVAEVEVGADGGFVAYVEIAPDADPRSLGLVAVTAGTRMASDTSVIVLPRETETAALDGARALSPQTSAESAAGVTAAEDAVVVESDAIDQVGVDDAGLSEAGEVAETQGTVPDVAPVEVATVAPEVAGDAPSIPEIAPGPSAPTRGAVLLAGPDGVKLLQPSDPAPEVLSTVALDTITYDPDGEVALGGRALGDGFVQVYLDNRPIMTAPVGVEGDWRTELPQIDTGVYTLRVDEIDADGRVLSRIETPFLREEPGRIAEVRGDGDASTARQVSVRTIQPGNTLWAIAEENYGEGTLYVRVFEANRDLIRDPDLIYPGQVFRVPSQP